MDKNNSYSEYILYIIVLILYGSFIEYMIHKYIMHQFKSTIQEHHVIHHNATKNDYTIDRNTKNYHKLEKGYNDNFCLGKTSLIFFVVLLIMFNLVYFKLLGIKQLKLNNVIILNVLLTTYIILVWNSIHPYIHSECGFKKCYGLNMNTTDKIVKNVPFFRFLVDNHKAHHYYKKEEKGNYNITIPIFDFLMNDYNEI
jgi:hypothetical protein